MPSTHLALLRGVNVGARNRLPMEDPAAIFPELGCRDVPTYIQSCNVISNASGLVDGLPGLVTTKVYLKLPHGVARTKLTNACFDSALRTVSTERDWGTVTRLSEMMKG